MKWDKNLFFNSILLSCSISMYVNIIIQIYIYINIRNISAIARGGLPGSSPSTEISDDNNFIYFIENTIVYAICVNPQICRIVKIIINRLW